MKDKAAFTELAHRAVGPVSAYIARRAYPLNADDVDDIVGETLTIAWRKYAVVPEGDDVAWMIGIARNVLRNHRRSQRRRGAAEGQVSPALPSSSTEDIVVANDAVTSALAALGPMDRETLLLSVWDGLSTESIAIALGTTPAAAAVRLSRAKTKFNELVAK